MKKKVFSLMMTLLLAFVGAVKADVVTIGEGTSTTYVTPFNSLWGYSFVEQIFTADEIGTAGTITSISFNLRETDAAQTNAVDVYMLNVSRSSFSSSTDYEPVTAADMVFSGTVTFSPGWTTITLDTPFEYDGSSNLLIGMHEYTSGYSTRYFYYTSATDKVLSYHSDSANPDPYNLGSYSGNKYTSPNRANIQIDITAGGGGYVGDRLHVRYMDGDVEVIDSLNMGVRPINAWMEPFNFTMYTEGPAYTVTVLDFTPSDGMFSVSGEELPFQVTRVHDVDLTLATNATQAGVIERQFVAITEGDRAAHIWPVVVELYAPEVPDVWELACEEATTFPFVEVPAVAHNTMLHNDYTLPFPEIPEGLDAVYKLTFDQDQILNAEVTYGDNGKVALYTEDFYGEGGPMADNNYTGLQIGGGASGGSFEAFIGDETSTSALTYFPFHTLWNYSLAENLFLASELTEAGVTSAPMTSLSWYVSSTTCTTPQNGISIWMANVSDAALTSTSHTTAGMTLVYTGANILPVVGWNEFEFNEGTFSWDGHSNILILCQRQNGSWEGSVSWQTHNPGFAATSYAYTDNAPGYDATTQTYSMSTSTTNRANIIMKSNRGRSVADREIVEIGDGTSTYYYYPVNMYFNYSLTEQLYTAEEIGTAGTINSISFYYDYSNSFSMDNVTLYMKNVTRNEFTSTTDMEPMSLNDIVWTGTLSAAGPGWITINLDTPFYYDGTSNLLVAGFDGTSGYPGSAYKFRTTSCDGYKGLSWYSDTYTPDPYTATSWSGSTNRTQYRANIQLDITSGGGGGGNDPAAYTYTAGPVITDLPVRPGTYYLVASSTTPNFEVTINAQDMPCPDVETFALNPTPADDADGIEPGSVTLRWNLPANATGWRLFFGTTYHPEPGHPQTIIYPEDGSFTTDLANSYTVRNLWNNTNYFWRVEFNNDGCPGGVSSPVWGFTTHLNIPQNLTAVDYTVFDDETIVLNWNPVVDRTYRMYNVYRDGELIGSTQVNNINNSTYTDGPLAYNMGGYTYYVTAVYDEGESAPSDPVTVKVSGYGNVDGHVYEQDGMTGIAGATVTMTGLDEFNVSHTYNFTTNNQGYYSGHIYAGTYNGQAAKDGYQTIYEPVQGNPIDLVYNQTTSPVDYMLDENFDPVCSVLAEYYPYPDSINAPYVKVSWGCGLPGEEIIEPFETGDFSLFDWQVDPTYPWTITTTNPYEGIYCMKSGGAGVANVVSNMSVTVNIPSDGLMSFFGKISCENSWDYGYFYIDGVQMASFTGAGNWVEKTYDITAGDHTFMWQYTKDGSVNSNDDCFYVDYISFYKQPAPPTPPVPGMTYDFEDHSMQGWTSVDADGDGHGWMVASELMSGAAGHNNSGDFVFSQSYDNTYGVLYPDNYLVSPQVALGGLVRFYACAQDNMYAAEHFGVAVSTTNTNPSSFTMVQEWTMSAKSVGEPGKPVRNSRSGREQGTWYEYTVDLSAYSGNGYVAIRHFNCSDMFYLDVDDITIGEPGAKGVASNDRALSHYRVYRTNCYNDGPYTEENTVLLSTVWVPDTVYIDVSWPDAAPGVYKWGVGTVYVGNRGEMIEGPISWTEPQATNRDFAADNTTNPVVGEVNGTRAPWDLMYTFNAAEGGQYGVVTDGQYIYTSNWGYSAAAHNFYKYDMQGNMIEGFEIPGCGTLRGMTFDGQYVYGVANSSTVYCVDLANHTLVNTFTSAYGAMRCISYDPERDGFWVVGNWSGNLTLINRQGAIVTSGPAPTSASDVAYYKDENNVEHVFCFDNGTNLVWDYDIAANSIVGTVFDFSVTPGFDGGSSGGCHVAEYQGKVAFFGDIQQSPNLIGIYELRNGGGVGPTPGPGGNNPIQEERESEIVWSNCLDKDMYLNAVTVNVLLNSADSPEGTTVDFTNLNEVEQQNYPVAQLVLDESGYYAFQTFRRGDYAIQIRHEGYEPIDDTVSIWNNMDLRYVMTEILYGVGNVYVSRTGWAMWDEAAIPGGGGGQGGSASTFNVDFEGGLPEGWTVNDANNDGWTWCLTSAIPTTWTYYASLSLDWYHSGTNAICSGSYINGVGAINPDEYLISPQVNLANGSQLSFWVAATDANYAADHFGVFVSTTGTNPSDFQSVQEWTLTGKGEGKAGNPLATRDGEGLRLGTWYHYTVDLSAYAGSNRYIAFRHFNCYDQYIMCLDDIELTSGAKDGGERHLEYYKVLCTSIDGVPIFNHNTVHPFCQLSTNEPYNAPLVEGEHYLCKVAVMYSTGMSEWSTPVEWEYEPCDHWGPVDEVTVGATTQGNHIEWVFDHGYNPYGGDVPGPGPQPGVGDWYYYDNGVNEDAIGTGGGNFWWGVMFPAGSYTGNMVTKVSAYDYMAMSGNVTIYVGGSNAPGTSVGQTNVTFTGSEQFVEFEFAEPVTIDPTQNVWVVFYNGSGATYPAAVCANTGDANGRWVSLDGAAWEDLAGYGLDYTFMVRAYIAQGAKGEVKEFKVNTPVAHNNGTFAISGNGPRALSGLNFNKGGEFYTQYAEDGIMLNFLALDNVNLRVYLLYVLSNDSRFSLVPEQEYGQFVLTSMTDGDFMNEFEAVYSNAVADFDLLTKVDIDERINHWKNAVSSVNLTSVMMDVLMSNARPDNDHCVNSLPFCTSEEITFEAASTSNTANEPNMDDGCIGSSYNPSFYHMRIHTAGPFVIHMEGHDPNNPSVTRDIDFCMWGPYTEQEVTSGTACSSLTGDKIMDCCYSAQYDEDCYLGYPEGQHNHHGSSTSHGYINYHVPEVGEYYILMITNFSQQPCVINFTKTEGEGETDCDIVTNPDIIGFLITQDGEYLAFAGPDDREYYDLDEYGDHEYCVRPIYPGEMVLPDHNYGWSMGCPVCEFGPNGDPTCEPGAPIHAEVLGETDQVKVWWGDAPLPPVPPMSEWLYYDDGVYGTSIGVGGGVIYWASMFPAASIAPYAGTNLTKVALYENSYNTDVVTVNIYLGGSAAPGTLVSTMNYNPVGGDAFHEVALTTPVAIDGTQNLWIVFSENGQYPANACADTGDPNNRWVSLDGADWMDVASAGVPGYGWMIRGFVTNEGKGGMVENIALEQPAVMESSVGMTLSHTEVVSKPADLSFMNRSDIVKYNVYRSDDNANYTMIGEVAAVAGQTYYEYIDTPAGAGTYYYQVRADYGDCESEPAMAAEDPANNYVTATVDAIGENSDNVALFPNPTNGNVTIQANGMSRITVVSVLGQVVYDKELNADEVTLNMGQFNAGLYMVRVYTESGVTVKRVTVMQ